MEASRHGRGDYHAVGVTPGMSPRRPRRGDMDDESGMNREIVGRFYDDVFVRHDLSKLDDYMRDDYIQHNADCPQGKTGFVEFFEVIFGAVPDFSYALKKMVAQGDLVVTFSTTTGTHTGGEWLGQRATGNRLSFNVVDIFRLEDGMIVEHWDVADTFTFFSQLGIAGRLLQERLSTPGQNGGC
jgi:predicted SnoaL-like aldol condensation-catalyzing enzyme